jgi:hypothetical protein
MRGYIKKFRHDLISYHFAIDCKKSDIWFFAFWHAPCYACVRLRARACACVRLRAPACACVRLRAPACACVRLHAGASGQQQEHFTA